MLAIQSIEAPSNLGMTEHSAEGRPLKPKTLPCKYCSKRFRRVEHVQRHERTHTKEKPFACNWARCGKTFGRRDLLVRHEKLVHLNEGSKDANRIRKTSSGSGHTMSSDDHGEMSMMGMQRRQSTTSRYPGQAPQPVPSPSQQHLAHVPHQQPPHNIASLPPPPPPTDPRLASRNVPACNLDLLSDAATHLASAAEINAMPPIMPDLGHPQTTAGGPIPPVKSFDATPPPYNDRSREAAAPQEAIPQAYPGQPPAASFDDYHLFLDDFTSSSHFLPSALENDQPFGMWGRPATEMGRGGNNLSKMAGSSFPSTRFPSVQPDMRDMHSEAGANRSQDEGSMRAPAWRIGLADHNTIKSRLEEFTSVLPADFVCPSRHTLTRFLEGYVSGFHEHLPFLHLPTLSPGEMSPELILAILAVGAQYRFENHRGNALWYAAKAIAFEQIRRRHSHEVHSLLPTSAAYSPHSTRPSPSTGYRHSFNSVQHDRPLTQDTHREPYSPNTPQARLETIQALLLLFAVGLWGPKAILHEALSLQSQLAVLVREEGLESQPSSQVTDWDTWIRVEGSTRTKLIAFCFFNLCSVVYNTPPLLLTSEVNLALPQPTRLWRMETAWQWQEARQAYGAVELPLQDAFSRILNRNAQQPLTHVSSLGNYILMHCFIQHIYLLKQTSVGIASPYGIHRGLKIDDVEEIAHGLRLWQIGFEQHRQMRAAESAHQQANMNPADSSYHSGSVTFNATALLRLAYIRLYTDLNPSRRLETRDHGIIANAFNDVPLLVRSPRTIRAVVQAIHALAMLVKAGVNYVARTKSLEWSMQLSLCNMECALLLSKWLLTLGSIGPNDAPISAEEKTLLDNVRRLLDETEFAVPIDPSLSGGGAASASTSSTPSASASNTDGAKMRQLATAVIHLWAETFKGSHIFEVISIMGQGLESYADILEKPGSHTPIGRIATSGGL